MQQITAPLAQIGSLAARLTAALQPKDRATLVTLSGSLGAGKTTFTQAIAKALGIEEIITSPTFVIENIYKLNDQKWQRLIHIDAYRLNSSKELAALGFEEILADPGNLIVLEWPERVRELIPTDTLSVQFDIKDDMRIININGQEI